jgi:hypothetical protein
MKLVDYKGDGITLLFMDCDQPKYDVEPFLGDLETSRPNDYNQLVSILDRAKKHGIVPNAQKTKPLHGDHAKPIWEFCARGGSRIFWFRDDDDGKIVVCTHGFIAKKNHDHKNDITRAQQRRAQYNARPR